MLWFDKKKFKFLIKMKCFNFTNLKSLSAIKYFIYFFLFVHFIFCMHFKSNFKSQYLQVL